MLNLIERDRHGYLKIAPTVRAIIDRYYKNGTFHQNDIAFALQSQGVMVVTDNKHPQLGTHAITKVQLARALNEEAMKKNNLMRLYVLKPLLKIGRGWYTWG